MVITRAPKVKAGRASFGGKKHKSTTAATPKRWITIKQLPDIGIDYHINHLRRLWQDGEFPAPKYLSPRKLVWDYAELMEWIASRVEVTS